MNGSTTLWFWVVREGSKEQEKEQFEDGAAFKYGGGYWRAIYR